MIHCVLVTQSVMENVGLVTVVKVVVIVYHDATAKTEWTLRQMVLLGGQQTKLIADTCWKLAVRLFTAPSSCLLSLNCVLQQS